MSSRALVVILLVACLSVNVALSASLEDMRQYPLVDKCSLCTKIVNEVKSSDAPKQWKPVLEYICVLAGSQAQSCKQAVDKYIDDISSKTADEFCKEMGLCQ